MHLKRKGNTFSISLNDIQHQNNCQSQTRFDNYDYLAEID